MSFSFNTFLVENEKESWRQDLVNDNISDSQSPIPLAESPVPSSSTMSSASKKRGRPTKSDTKS